MSKKGLQHIMEDPPEFIQRCLHCGVEECNCGGDYTMDRCIFKNGIDFESPPRKYTKPKLDVPKLQTLQTGTDWRK